MVADQRAPRDGRFIENIGKYHPLEDPSLIEIDEERALHWLRVGAQPSSQVRNLMVKIGIWDRFVEERPAAADQVRKRTEKPEGGLVCRRRPPRRPPPKPRRHPRHPRPSRTRPLPLKKAVESAPEAEAAPEAPRAEAAPETAAEEAPAAEEPGRRRACRGCPAEDAPAEEETTEA